MSPVIAFDIAVGAQKVKVQCCCIMADMLNLKKWGRVSSRSGWLLELLTEPNNEKDCRVKQLNSESMHYAASHVNRHFRSF